MISKRELAVTALIASGLISNDGFAGNLTYKGSAQTTAQKSLLPLASGDTVVTSASHGVAAISTDPPTILTVKCAGLGTLKANDEFSGDAYCTFSANDTDRLDVKGSERPGSPATLEVIGGSGKWAGARGTGVFTRVGSEGEHNFFNFEIELTAP